MSYKLTYFDTTGRGEAIRLIFAAVGVKFADDRIKPDKWPSVKSSTPWESLPVLHVGDKTLAQTVAICRYLGRKFKLIGANEWESAKCDEYVDAINDLYLEWIKYEEEEDHLKKAELKQNFVSILVPKYLVKMNILKCDNGGKYLIGQSLTWADIVIADRLQTLEDTVDQGILNGYPHLRKMKDAVYANPRIKDYVQDRLPQ